MIGRILVKRWSADTFYFFSRPSYCSINVPDPHRTILESGKWLPAAFLKDSMQIREIVSIVGRGGIAFAVSKTIGVKGTVREN
jgi:hypothetical protein